VQPVYIEYAFNVQTLIDEMFFDIETDNFDFIADVFIQMCACTEHIENPHGIMVVYKVHETTMNITFMRMITNITMFMEVMYNHTSVKSIVLEGLEFEQKDLNALLKWFEGYDYQPVVIIGQEGKPTYIYM